MLSQMVLHSSVRLFSVPLADSTGLNYPLQPGSPSPFLQPFRRTGCVKKPGWGRKFWQNSPSITGARLRGWFTAKWVSNMMREIKNVFLSPGTSAGGIQQESGSAHMEARWRQFSPGFQTPQESHLVPLDGILAHGRYFKGWQCLWLSLLSLKRSPYLLGDWRGWILAWRDLRVNRGPSVICCKLGVRNSKLPSTWGTRQVQADLQLKFLFLALYYTVTRAKQPLSPSNFMGTLDARQSSSVLLQGTIQCTFRIPVLLSLISACPRDCLGLGKQISLMYHWSLSWTERQNEKRHNAVVYWKCLSTRSYLIMSQPVILNSPELPARACLGFGLCDLGMSCLAFVTHPVIWHTPKWSLTFFLVSWGLLLAPNSTTLMQIQQKI